jgi:hypothetical protein
MPVAERCVGNLTDFRELVYQWKKGRPSITANHTSRSAIYSRIHSRYQTKRELIEARPNHELCVDVRGLEKLHQADLRMRIGCVGPSNSSRLAA